MFYQYRDLVDNSFNLLTLYDVFIKLVWKKTREIGADFKTRTDGRLVVVVRYFPPGNYVGEEPFRNNVLRPRDWQPPTQPEENAGIALVFSNFALVAFIVVVSSSLKY